MREKQQKIGVAGASSLLGKELAEELQNSAMGEGNVTLLDEGEVAGQLETVADEVTFVQKLEPTSFEGLDFVFFTGSPDSTLQYWDGARRWGASIVDMTYALEAEKDALVLSPLLPSQVAGREKSLSLNTRAVVSAHPAAIMLALAAQKLSAVGSVRSLTATVLEPASEQGRLAMDELHQQTVSLLSFQTVPKDHFDAQVAFNLLPSLGEDAKLPLQAVSKRIFAHYAKLGGAAPLAMQLVQAPVFHGYTISLLVEFTEPVMPDALEAALAGEGMDVLLDEFDPPSNLGAAGQGDILVRINADDTGTTDGTRFWIWMAADNLKLAARNALACATEMKKLRPQGPVQ